MAVNPIPEGYHTVTPYLSISNASEAIEFYKQAFNAEEIFRLSMPNGDVGHAEIKIGHSHLMLSDTCDEAPMPSPNQLGGTSVGIYLYVEDVDALFAQALKAGATVIEAVEDKFYGDRTGSLKDPYGHVWFIGTHKEDLSPDEIEQRAAEMFSE